MNKNHRRTITTFITGQLTNRTAKCYYKLILVEVHVTLYNNNIKLESTTQNGMGGWGKHIFLFVAVNLKLPYTLIYTTQCVMASYCNIKNMVHYHDTKLTENGLLSRQRNSLRESQEASPHMPSWFLRICTQSSSSDGLVP